MLLIVLAAVSATATQAPHQPVELEALVREAQPYLKCLRGFDTKRSYAQSSVTAALDSLRYGRSDRADSAEQLRAAAEKIRSLDEEIDQTCGRSALIDSFQARFQSTYPGYSTSEYVYFTKMMLRDIENQSASLARFSTREFHLPPPPMPLRMPGVPETPKSEQQAPPK